MFEGLHSQGQQTEVRDWVLLSLGSFVQRFVLFLVLVIALSVFVFFFFLFKWQKCCVLVKDVTTSGVLKNDSIVL